MYCASSGDGAGFWIASAIPGGSAFLNTKDWTLDEADAVERIDSGLDEECIVGTCEYNTLAMIQFGSGRAWEHLLSAEASGLPEL